MVVFRSRPGTPKSVLTKKTCDDFRCCSWTIDCPRASVTINKIKTIFKEVDSLVVLAPQVATATGGRAQSCGYSRRFGLECEVRKGAEDGAVLTGGRCESRLVCGDNSERHGRSAGSSTSMLLRPPRQSGNILLHSWCCGEIHKDLLKGVAVESETT